MVGVFFAGLLFEIIGALYTIAAAHNRWGVDCIVIGIVVFVAGAVFQGLCFWFNRPSTWERPLR